MFSGKFSLLVAALAAFYFIPVHSIPTRQQEGSRDASQSWQTFVKAPKSGVIFPVGVVNTTGDVENVEALLGAGNRYATLRRSSPFNTTVNVLKKKDGSPDDIPSVTLDFGINVVGFAQMSFAGASSNSPGLKVAFSETLEFLSNRSDFTRSDNGDTITAGTDQIAVPRNSSIWIDVHGCKFGDKVCSDGLHGFRYMKISLDAEISDAPYTSPYGEVKISSVSLKWSGFLGTPDTFTGWFECSDNQLTEYWYSGVYTNDMCIDIFRQNDTDPRDAFSETLNGKLVIHDGAKRDRDPYVGDIAVSGPTVYLTHNVSIAPKNVLADLADHQRGDGWIPPASISNYNLPLFDYPLWWVVCSYDLYMYTGDSAYIEQYYPNLVKALDVYYITYLDADTGLLSKESGYGDYAFLPREGIVTYYNVLYVLALQNAAAIATSTNRPADATRWTARANALSAAINAHLWDPSVGAYFDSLGGTSHAQDGNSIAIITGVASASRAQSILNYYESVAALPYGNAFYDSDAIGDGFSTRVYAFISYFELRARFESNKAVSALNQIRRMYGWMSSHDPYSTFWEGIGANGSMYEGAFTSAAHGWSTGVVSLLTNSVLGVTPTGPGFSSWAVRPVPGDITWARGRVPTPQGWIDVDWQIGSIAAFSISVAAPLGTVGTVAVPSAISGTATSIVLLDGETIWSEASGASDNATVSTDDGCINIAITGGEEHVVKVKQGNDAGGRS